jgi:hypothetical protein
MTAVSEVPGLLFSDAAAFVAVMTTSAKEFVYGTPPPGVDVGSALALVAFLLSTAFVAVRRWQRRKTLRPAPAELARDGVPDEARHANDVRLALLIVLGVAPLLVVRPSYASLNYAALVLALIPLAAARMTAHASAAARLALVGSVTLFSLVTLFWLAGSLTQQSSDCIVPTGPFFEGLTGEFLANGTALVTDYQLERSALYHWGERVERFGLVTNPGTHSTLRPHPGALVPPWAPPGAKAQAWLGFETYLSRVLYVSHARFSPDALMAQSIHPGLAPVAQVRCPDGSAGLVAFLVTKPAGGIPALP